MNIDRDALRDFLSRDLLDFFVRLGLLVLAVVACERIFAPFLPLMLWALILAVCFYPLHLLIGNRFGWSPGRSATLLVFGLILLIGVPTVMLGMSFANHIYDVITELRGGELTLDMPSESVRDWPVVGERVYKYWVAAATDLPATLKELEPVIAQTTRRLMSSAASTAGTLFFFIGAIIVSGIMMAYGQAGAAVMGRVSTRIAGAEQGPALHRLSTLTVRSVATGVVGVAFIQALLLGVGFMVAGIPAAGVLALVVLVMGILQLPALILTLPAIAYMWGVGDGGTVMNSVLTVYLLIAGAADGFLKPLLLGRGVDVPMPIVLIGALGGMVASGIIGLFIGAVVLSVGYELFMGWLKQGELSDPVPEDSAGS
jgi:predicted PurR-regulated permease PerM